MDILRAKNEVEKLNNKYTKYILSVDGDLYMRYDTLSSLKDEEEYGPLYISHKTGEIIRYKNIRVAMATNNEEEIASCNARAFKGLIVEVSSEKEGGPSFSFYTLSSSPLFTSRVLTFGPDLAVDVINDAIKITSPLGYVCCVDGYVYGVKK